MPKGYPPPTIRTKRRLTVDAQFDPAATEPLTVLSLGPELQDGGDPEPITVECHGPLALQTEHLQTSNIVDLEYSSHWAPKVYDRSREVGVYVDKWICRSIISMSRDRSGPLRTPPQRKGEWGPFEALCYQGHLRQVKGGY
jgi:hypothetical protein